MRHFDVLGLFPAVGDGVPGGVQLSGRLAWEALRERPGTRTFRISYGPSQTPFEDEGSFDTSSRSRSAWRAGQVALACRHVVVWHLGLAPLLLTRPIPRGVAVFLHGVEAWKPLKAAQRAALTMTRPLLLTNSETTRQRFLAANGWALNLRMTIVPLGVGQPPDRPGTPPASSPAAVAIGRLDRGEDYKGHRELIAAWPQVLRAIPQAQLWIIGEGSLRAELEASVRSAGLDRSVQFLGQVSDRARDDRIASARCLALPSRGEGFGLVYVEAMRLGRPCLVSDADAGREVVQPPTAGLEVDPRNGDQVASALVRLLSASEEWARWSAAASQRYASLYTADAFKQRFLDAWAQVN